MPSVPDLTLGKPAFFAECQIPGTRQTCLLCRVSNTGHSAKTGPERTNVSFFAECHSADKLCFALADKFASILPLMQASMPQIEGTRWRAARWFASTPAGPMRLRLLQQQRATTPCRINTAPSPSVAASCVSAQLSTPTGPHAAPSPAGSVLR